jgi:hypothetical protein
MKIRKDEFRHKTKECPAECEIVTVQFNFKDQNFHVENLKNYCRRGVFDPNKSYHVLGFFNSYKEAHAFVDNIREKKGLKTGHPY